MSPRQRLLSAQTRSTVTRASWVSARPSIALRIAYLFMLGCAAYAPIELARLIVLHHDTYDQLTLVPIFGLELAVLAWGILGVVVAATHAWLWVFGFRGRRSEMSRASGQRGVPSRRDSRTARSGRSTPQFLQARSSSTWRRPGGQRPPGTSDPT